MEGSERPDDRLPDGPGHGRVEEARYQGGDLVALAPKPGEVAAIGSSSSAVRSRSDPTENGPPRSPAEVWSALLGGLFGRGLVSRMRLSARQSGLVLIAF